MVCRWFMLLLLACVLLAPHVASQFSFSLPGKWGSGKRAAPSWAGTGKNGGTECGEFDPDTLFNLYRTVQNEALRISECLLKGSEPGDTKH